MAKQTALFAKKITGWIVVCLFFVGWNGFAQARTNQAHSKQILEKTQTAQKSLQKSAPSDTKIQSQNKPFSQNIKKYSDGIFQGSGEGFGGEIFVEVSIQNSVISKIEITSAKHEDAPYLREAKAIISKIIKTQHTDLDAISGATPTSWGILDGVDAALEKAKEKNK